MKLGTSILFISGSLSTNIFDDHWTSGDGSGEWDTTTDTPTTTSNPTTTSIYSSTTTTDYFTTETSTTNEPDDWLAGMQIFIQSLILYVLFYQILQK